MANAKGKEEGLSKNPSFEQAMVELEAIVGQMDDGSLTLEQSLAAYRRGADLVKVCHDALALVRQQVQVLDGELVRPAPELDGLGDA